MENFDKLSDLVGAKAKFAFKCAQEAKSEKFFEEYKSHVKKIPMLIRTNGLGAAVAFIKAKQQNDPKKPINDYNLIYQQIKKWLNEDENNWVKINSGEDLTGKIIHLDSEEYQMVTKNLLSFFDWLKRFAEGLNE
jgi:CRISPR-associated protein Cmr5